MSEQLQGFRGVGIGAGSLDLFRPRGEVGADHQPGTKPGWQETDNQLLMELLDDPRVEQHTGGNIINVLAYLACQKAFRELSFLGVLGDEQNMASQAIRRTLEQFAINNLGKEIPGYEPSISIIETLATPGSDRMIRGRPRGDMQFEDGEIQDALREQDVVIISSVKKPSLVEEIFASVEDESTIVSCNPGSTELTANPAALRRSMQQRNPYLLVLNDTELRTFMEDADSNLYNVALKASAFSTFLLCTRGKTGMMLVNNGDIVESMPSILNQRRVVNTLGAGDRAHATALFELLQGSSPEAVFAAVARETAEVVQVQGSHEDLYRKIGTTSLELAEK